MSADPVRLDEAPRDPWVRLEDLLDRLAAADQGPAWRRHYLNEFVEAKPAPQARARRLDHERDEAGREYRRRIFAADEAWRAIGGRP